VTSDRLKVLYIAGAHRSGTTLLSDILGSYDSVTGTGELHELWAGLLSGRPCGCGRSLLWCPVWGAVIERLRRPQASPDWTPSDAVAWRNRTARVWHTPALVARTAARPRAVQQRDPYALLIAATYRAVAETQGSRVVVDSTKVPAGAALLVGMPEIESYVLHMVRDPRATVYSWATIKSAGVAQQTDDLRPVGATRATLRWLAYNGLSELLGYSFRSRYLMLTYEQFMNSPQETLATIGTWIGEKLHPDPFRTDGMLDIGSSHSVAGNPSRFANGPRPVKLDDSWVDKMSAGKKLYVSMFTTPLHRRYGYS
jgi:hypothetical protein